MPLRGSTQRSICGHLRPTTIPKRARSTSTRVETGQASLKLPKSQLHKPQLDYHVLLADPARTTKNHIDRRTPLTLGSQHVPRMQVLREAQLSLQREIASVKSKQKEIEEKMKHDPDFRAHGRTQAQRIKAEALTHETELNTTEAELLDLGLALPNFSDPVSPVGPEDSAIEIARYGPSPISSDPKRDHLDLCAHWGLLDPSASAITSGTSFPFLKSTLALLEQSLINYALSIAISHGYTPVIPPDVVRSDLAWRCGFQPRDPEAAAATQTYTIHTPPASPELCLAGTAEVPLSGLFADRMFRGEEMPMKVVGVGRAFRAEAGARGKDTRGLYRVHQFTKVELFTVCEPGDSEACFKSMGEVQKQVAEGLDIPLRSVHCPRAHVFSHRLIAGCSRCRPQSSVPAHQGNGTWKPGCQGGANGARRVKPPLKPRQSAYRRIVDHVAVQLHGLPIPPTPHPPPTESQSLCPHRVPGRRSKGYILTYTQWHRCRYSEIAHCVDGEWSEV